MELPADSGAVVSASPGQRTGRSPIEKLRGKCLAEGDRQILKEVAEARVSRGWQFSAFPVLRMNLSNFAKLSLINIHEPSSEFVNQAQISFLCRSTSTKGAHATASAPELRKPCCVNSDSLGIVLRPLIS